VNELLDIDDSTVPVKWGQEPLINCCFITVDLIFVNLLHKRSKTNWHFLYDCKSRKIKGESYKNILFKESQLNFPIKTIYNKEKSEVYFFYKLGECFTVDMKDLSKVRHQQLVGSCLSQLYLIFDKILVAQSSLEVLFYKQQERRADG
jgi:hypothetical protein